MKYLFVIIALFTLPTFFAQDAKADAILEKVSAKIKGYKSFYLEFSAVVKNSSTGLNENETGKGWVKGEKYHASYGENTVISNGIKSWTIVKEEKTVYEMDASEDDEESINPKKLMTMWETGFKSHYDKESTFGTTPVHLINLYPKNPAKVDYHTITLFVTKSDNELKKVIMKTKDGTYMSYTITQFKANPSVEDSEFVFDKGKFPGYNVIKD